jgi:D-beta-D-heptose 7-phosphate kinase/D-beta-D-heptose 1-phosphate adenosyltransferase
MHSINAKRLHQILRRFSKTNVLVVGDIMLDEYVWGKVTRISPEAPVPVVHVHHETLIPGGAANVARNIRSLGGKAILSGVLGGKEYGRELLNLLQKEKIGTGCLITNKKLNTILKTRVVAHSQQVVRIDKEKNTLPKDEDIVKLRRVIERTIPNIDCVVIEDYGKGVVNQGLVYLLADLCEKYKKPLIADPKKGHMLDYSGITSMTPNLEEALSIVGLDYKGEYLPSQIEEAGKLILDKWNLKSILITLGEHGMSLSEKDGHEFKIPTMAKEVYDVSGAGDTVIGVFATALGTGATMKESAILSNIAAGIVVGKVGTAVATVEEMEEEINKWTGF